MHKGRSGLQLRAKDLELELAAVQIKEREEVVGGLKAQLEASKESELLLHQQITQQHEKVEEVKATIAKTTEVRPAPSCSHFVVDHSSYDSFLFCDYFKLAFVRGNCSDIPVDFQEGPSVC